MGGTSSARPLIEGLIEHSVCRVVLLSGAAVELPGEGKAFGDRLASASVCALAKHVVAAKQAELDAFLAKGRTLEWVAARPPRVVSGPPTGRVRAGTDLRLGLGSRITEADLAAFLISQLNEDRWIRQAPFVSS